MSVRRGTRWSSGEGYLVWSTPCKREVTVSAGGVGVGRALETASLVVRQGTGLPPSLLRTVGGERNWVSGFEV